MLDKQGIHVVAAVLSIFPEWQRWNRANFSHYFQVFLDVPTETLRARDAKGLYRAAERGEIKNVIGVDIAFPSPVECDMTVAGAAALMPTHEIVRSILSRLPAPLGSNERP